MKQLLLENWKGKIASLVLAVLIWFLIDSNLRRPDRLQIPVPGTVSPLPDTNPNSVVPIPGGGSPSSSFFSSPPVRIEAAVERHLFALHWIDESGFSDSVLIYPGVSVSA